MWVLESISVAIDQAYGAAADASSPVASATLTPVFASLAVVGIVPVLLLLRRFDGEGLVTKLARLAPPAERRTVWAWLLAGVAADLRLGEPGRRGPGPPLDRCRGA